MRVTVWVGDTFAKHRVGKPFLFIVPEDNILL